MPTRKTNGLQRPKLLALAVFVVGILLAAAVGIANRTSNQRTARARFDSIVERTVFRLESRMQSYAYGLRGARGLVIGAGLDQLTRERFREYAASRMIEQEFPGTRGFGFIRRVKAEDEPELVIHARRDRPDFTIHPPGLKSQERYVIQYLEPEDANAAAIGFDIATESNRRNAAEQAAMTGGPTLTAPITLLQAKHRPLRALLLLLPVYASGQLPTSAAERAARTVGWTYTPLVIDDVLRGFDYANDALHLVLSDVSGSDATQPFFDSLAEAPADHAALSSRISKELFGRRWLIEIHARTRFMEQLDLPNPLGTFAIGALLAILCAGLFYTYRVSGSRAYELRTQQARAAAVSDNASDAIIGKTLDGVVTSWNKAAQRLFGYTAEDAIGHTVLELLVPDDRREEEADILARLSRGEHVARLDTVRRRRDGTLVEVAVASSPIVDEKGSIIGVAKTVSDITAKKALERKLLELNAALAEQVRERTALHESVRRDLDTILDAVPFMIAYWDKDMHCRFANRGYAQWYGLQPHELIGKRLQDLLGSRFAASQPFFERALRGEEHTLERAVPDKDGEPAKQLEVHLLPDKIDGDVQGFYLLAHNVTEQMRNRERLAAALHETEALLSVIQQHAIVSMTDRSGKIIDANEAFCRISGYSREELLGKDHRIVNSGHHPRSLWREMWKTVASGTPWRHVIRNRAKDGSIYWVDTIIAPFANEKGKVTRYISIRFDVTAAKRSEIALRASEALQRGILSHAGSSIIATDLSGKITLWNRAAEALLGYTVDEVVGMSTPIMIHEPAELEARRAALEAEGISVSAPWDIVVAKSSPGKVDKHEWTYVRKDGSRVPVLLSVSCLLDDAGTGIGYLGIAVDLSERKDQERELVELNRLLAERSAQAESANTAKSMFLANMSHEIRTPLNAVIGLTYLLEQGALDREQISLVNNIKLAGRSLLGVVNNVLDLTKIEAGEMLVEESTFDLFALLEQLVSVLLVQATAKGISLSMQRDEDIPRMLRGDGQHLRQILTNLLSNAIKFTERGGVTLRVSSAEVTDKRVQLRFVVTDSGIGIAPALQGKLFSPFTQADASTTRRFGGTGLGLSIVRRLVALMDGEVSVSSAEGTGSEFVVTLPFWIEDRLRSGPARPVEALIVGDDASYCAGVAGMAAALGWHPETIGAGVAALERLQRRLKGTRVEVLVLAMRASDDAVGSMVAELRTAIPRAQFPAIVLASSDGSEGYDKALLASGIPVTILRGEPSTSSLFNAVQEALAVATASDETPPPLAAVDSQPLAGRRILVADDSNVNLEIAAKILGRCGARVRVVVNGQQAVDVLSEEASAFDAVLMDVQMPVIDGLEATRRIRGTLGLKSLPIIALTAGALSSERQRASLAGMDDFISKPFEPRVMIEKLCKHMTQATTPSVSKLASGRSSVLPPGWPVVDGIDTRIAFTSLDGDVELMKRLLHTLLNECADLELPSEHAALSGKTLVARLHKLSGAAGTMGALELAAAAKAWQASAESADAEGIERSSGALARELRRLRAAVALLPTTDSTRPAATGERVTDSSLRGPLATNEGFDELVALLQRQSFKALELFATLSPALRGEMSEADFAELSDSLNALKYKAALQVLLKVRLAS